MSNQIEDPAARGQLVVAGIARPDHLPVDIDRGHLIAD
jgi:hypothetical protein